MVDASGSAAGDLLSALVQAVPALEPLPESVETAVLRWLNRPGSELDHVPVLLEMVKRKELSEPMRDRLGRSSHAAVKAAWLSRDDHADGYVAGQLAREKRAKVLSAVIRSQNASVELLRAASKDKRRMVQESLLSRSDLPDDLVVEALVHTVVKPRTYELKRVVSEWTQRRPELVPQVVARLTDVETKTRLFCSHRGEFSTEEATVLLEETIAPALVEHIDKVGAGSQGRYSYWNMPNTALWYHAESEVLFATVTCPRWQPLSTPKLLAAFAHIAKVSKWPAQPAVIPSSQVASSPVTDLLKSSYRSRQSPTPQELELAHAAMFASAEVVQGMVENRSGSSSRRVQQLARETDLEVLVSALKDTAPGRPPEADVVRAVLGNPALDLAGFASHPGLVKAMSSFSSGSFSHEVQVQVAEMVWRRWREDPLAAAVLLLWFDGALPDRLEAKSVFTGSEFDDLASGVLAALKSMVQESGSVGQLSWSVRQMVSDVVQLVGRSPRASELLALLPFRDLRWILELGDAPQLAEAAAGLLDQVSDDEQWETLLGLSETFNGSLADLVAVSSAV